MPDAPTMPIQIVGDLGGGVCEGDFCEIPEHHEQAVVNRAIDSGNV
jgi:hypothetical protein